MASEIVLHQEEKKPVVNPDGAVLSLVAVLSLFFFASMISEDSTTLDVVLALMMIDSFLYDASWR